MVAGIQKVKASLGTGGAAQNVAKVLVEELTSASSES
jgi:hypothetical protein